MASSQKLEEMVRTGDSPAFNSDGHGEIAIVPTDKIASVKGVTILQPVTINQIVISTQTIKTMIRSTSYTSITTAVTETSDGTVFTRTVTTESPVTTEAKSKQAIEVITSTKSNHHRAERYCQA